METEKIKPSTGEIVREEFNSHQVARTGETAVSAAAAQAKAQVEAMYIMAMNRPRDWSEVRQKALAECKRPGLAANCRYTLPWAKDPKTGKPITGPNIRLAEAFLRSTPNLSVRTNILYDDAERRVGEVVIIDLETNNPLSWGFSIEKSREVKQLRGGEMVLGERVNSKGQKVFKIVAEEAQVLQKQESTVSRILRNGVFRLIPGDLLDEALSMCDSTMREKDISDPAGTAKKLADGFLAIGISAKQLQKYLGHAVDQVTPDEAQDLRAVYSSIVDEGAKWSDIIEAKHSEKPKPPSDEELEERKQIIKYMAEQRVKNKEVYEEALLEANVNLDIQPTALSIDVLRKIQGLLKGNGKKAEGGAQ